jgi:CHAT domain-containing protein/Tfp pilus assembly protein PilF
MRQGLRCRFLVDAIVAGYLLALFVAASAVPGALHAEDSNPLQGLSSTAGPEITSLDPGKPVQRELTGQETHVYRVTMSEAQYGDVVVEQRGIDLTVELMDATGKLLAEFDSESRIQGEERVGWVAESAGTYQLSVKAKYPRMAAGRYEIRLTEVRAAVEQDRALYEAHKLGTEALTLSEAGKYEEAIKLTQRALELSQRTSGPDDAYVGYLTMRAGLLQRTKGDYASAEPTLQRAVSINEKALGKEHPQTALSVEYLGLVYSSKDDYAKAEQYVQQALEINEKTLGREHPAVATCMMQISLFRQKRGDFQAALSLLQRALAIADKVLEPDDFLSIALVHNLGNLYLDQGDYDRAEPLTERALQMAEKKYGPDDPRVAIPLQNLGSIARKKRQYTHALELLERAEAIREKTLGSHHPGTASLLLNIGNVYKEQGDYAKAQEFYQRALSILETVAGPYHQLTLMSLANIANTYSALGNSARAVEYQSRVDDVVEKQIELNLAAGSERQKLAYTDWMSERIDRTISLHVQGAPNDRVARELAALAILRRKGRVLDAVAGSLTALRQHMKPEDRKLIDQLDSTDAELAKVALNGPGKMPAEEYAKQLRLLEEKREELEASISQSSAGYYEQTGMVTLAAVKAAIPAQAALVELAVYRPFDPKAIGQETTQYGHPRYVAYIIPNQGEVRWKDLGSAKDIDSAADAFRQALRDPKRSDAKQRARVLDEQTFRPLRALVGDATQLLISPDGELNLIPFEALVDEQDHYLVERYSISYLTSGRDLLRMQVARASKSGPLVIADPSFDEPAPVLTASAGQPKLRPNGALSRRRSITTGEDLSSMYFAPLAGTAQEARSIQSLFPEARVLTGPQATVDNLKQADAPRILHIATHGFFLEDSTRNAAPDASKPGANGTRARKASVHIENPLLRSGLALAGANLNKSGHDAGILTALEASNLDLWGTKLVTLSACDTGVGEVKTGEGIYGLRRAFFRAGAETLVMSLWPVSDHVTREMMTAYYTGLKRGLGRGEALRQAELAMLKRKDRQHPFYWASFIQSGEWANLDGKR